MLYAYKTGFVSTTNPVLWIQAGAIRLELNFFFEYFAVAFEFDFDFIAFVVIG